MVAELFIPTSGPEIILELVQLFQSPVLKQIRQAKSDAHDDTHSWVDPGGYQLSDRIWRQKKHVREWIEEEIRVALQYGEDALVLAERLEAGLHPALQPVRTADGKIINTGAKGVLTNTPRGGAGSYSARRLARTEITRAHGVTVDKSAEALGLPVQWNLSNRHPKIDICDENASGSSAGLPKGVYHVSECPQYPAHPHCLCTKTTYDDRTEDEIVDYLRQKWNLPTAKPVPPAPPVKKKPGPPKGYKYPEGAKKPGPKKKTATTATAPEPAPVKKKPGPPKGYKYPEGAAKPGPKKKSTAAKAPAPAPAPVKKKPGPAKGYKYPEGAAKPGPKPKPAYAGPPKLTDAQVQKYADEAAEAAQKAKVAAELQEKLAKEAAELAAKEAAEKAALELAAKKKAAVEKMKATKAANAAAKKKAAEEAAAKLAAEKAAADALAKKLAEEAAQKKAADLAIKKAEAAKKKAELAAKKKAAADALKAQKAAEKAKLLEEAAKKKAAEKAAKLKAAEDLKKAKAAQKAAEAQKKLEDAIAAQKAAAALKLSGKKPSGVSMPKKPYAPDPDYLKKGVNPITPSAVNVPPKTITPGEVNDFLKGSEASEVFLWKGGYNATPAMKAQGIDFDMLQAEDLSKPWTGAGMPLKAADTGHPMQVKIAINTKSPLRGTAAQIDAEIDSWKIPTFPGQTPAEVASDIRKEINLRGYDSIIVDLPGGGKDVYAIRHDNWRIVEPKAAAVPPPPPPKAPVVSTYQPPWASKAPPPANAIPDPPYKVTQAYPKPAATWTPKTTKSRHTESSIKTAYNKAAADMNARLPYSSSVRGYWSEYKGSGYGEMNDFLRWGHPEGAAGVVGKKPIRSSFESGYVEQMDALYGEWVLEKPADLYRGMHFPKEYTPDDIVNAKPGTVLTDPGYVSTSHAKSVAESFSGKYGGEDSVVLFINAPAGASYVPVDGISGLKESELVFPRGSRFVVTGVRQRPKPNSPGNTIYELDVDLEPPSGKKVPLLKPKVTP